MTTLRLEVKEVTGNEYCQTWLTWRNFGWQLPVLEIKWLSSHRNSMVHCQPHIQGF